MALTLEEAKSLIAALGVKIPEAILEQKAKAEEFQARRAKVVAAAGNKPANWQFKQKFNEVLHRAVESAGTQQLDAALKLLDETEQVLQQPDAPAPPPPVTPGTTPSTPSPDIGKPNIAFNQDFQRKWAAAKKVWLSCLETVDDQLDQVRAKMLASADPDFKLIAERGLPALTDNHKTPVMKALFELDGPPGEPRNNAALKVGAAISAFRNHLDSYNLIRALDKHGKGAFGVSLTLRSEIAKGLNALEQALQVPGSPLAAALEAKEVYGQER